MKIPELQGGPLAVIGDVHGELEALEALLRELDELDLGRPKRALCFVGDLVDRGPDSPGVMRRVRGLIDEGRAQLVLGNHELNLLRMDVEPKADNSWMRGEERHLGGGETLPERLVTSADERAELLAMLADVPVALEREDLRVVHAAWDDAALERLANEARSDPPNPGSSAPRAGLLARHESSLQAIRERLAMDGTLDRARAEAQRIHEVFPIGVLGDETHAPEVSLAIQAREMALQNEDPLRLVTSGPEGPSDRVFAAGGKWRHTRRAAWWNEYVGKPVAFGHYWRGAVSAEVRRPFAPPDHFEDGPSTGPLGPLGRAHCLDYSVGRRFLERMQMGTQPRPFHGRLAALLWPENWTLFDDGQIVR